MASASWVAAGAQAAPKPQKSEVTATGRQEVVVELDTFGRYAVRAASKQGTAVQVVDRMTGPGELRGVPGEANGRVDLFLERGDIKVVALSHAQGDGTATVEVLPFQELHSKRAPRLVELKLVSDSLGDLEQRSYWIEIPERRSVSLEASGRHLRDLRLWQDGSWLHESTPDCRPSEPQVGRPLTACTLHTLLEPGLYLVSAYGGEPLPWAEGGTEKPFYLRWGVPQLGEAGRMSATMSPLGTDRWLVPGTASYFRLELPEKRPATLRVVSTGGGSPFATGGASGQVTDESRLPLVELYQGASSEQVVTITAAPGQPYVLQHFHSTGGTRSLRDTGRTYVLALHGGAAGDEADATALVVHSRDRQPSSRRIVPELSRGIQLDDEHHYERRFNLLERTELYLDVRKAGKYRLIAEGPRTTLRVEPVLFDPPRDYRRPEPQLQSLERELDQGFHLLTLEPQEPGIVTLRIDPRSFGRRALGLFGGGKTKPAPAPLPLSAVALDVGYEETFEIRHATRPRVATGILARPHPLSLALPLPVALGPGETLTIPVHIPAPGQLVAKDGGGGRLPLSMPGAEGKWLSLEAGDLSVTVHNPSRELVHASLVLTPNDLLPERPLPAIAAATLEKLPRFPELTVAPAHGSLARDERETWLVQVREPGLYHLATTGLLATEGRLRTRVRTGFAQAAANGVGRNFLIEQYLRPGTYQLTFAARGRSAGAFGLELSRTTPVDGGELKSGIPARVTLPPARAVAYQFHVADPGRFELRSYGQHRDFECRIEDEGGWPIMEPVVACNRTLTLTPGPYRVIVQPAAVATRRITELVRLEEPPERRGHGPHPLPLDTTVEHLWTEPPAGDERLPDVWTFALPAKVSVAVTLSSEMHGSVVAAGGEVVALLAPGRAFEGELAAGTYRLEVKSARRNNRLPYSVRLEPRALLAGLERQVPVPGVVAVAMGTGEGGHALAELASEGQVDVRARLFDAGGKLVAANDDRPDDWNFRMTRRLAPGPYELRLDSADGRAGAVTVRMRAPEELAGEPLAAGKRVSLGLGGEVRVLPVELGGARPLLLVGSDSRENVGVALEAVVDGAVHTLGTATGLTNRLAVRDVGPGVERYQVRVWSLDHRGNPVELFIDAPPPLEADEDDLEDGITLRAREPLYAVHVEMQPGLVSLEQLPAEAQVCSAPGEACVEPHGELAAAGADGLWLVAKPGELRGRRVVLQPGRPVSAGLGEHGSSAVDLAGKGPVAVMAHSPTGQPGLAFTERAAGTERSARGMAAGNSAALVVDLTGKASQVALWSASREELVVRLEAVRLARAERLRLEPGVAAGELGPHTLIVAELPQAELTLGLSLPAGVAAVLPAAQGSVWADGAPARFEGVVHGGEVALVNLGDEPAPFTVELAPGGVVPAAVAIQYPFETVAATRQVLRVPVASLIGGKLYAAGQILRATYLRDDGQVLAALPADVGRGGVLELEVGPGWVTAWAEMPLATSSPWPPAPPGEEVAVSGAARVELGRATVPIRLEPGHAALASVRVASPAVAYVWAHGGGVRMHLLETGGAVSLWLPHGSGGVQLRGLGGAPLAGVAEVSFTTPTDIVEGLGPEVLVPPGGGRLFRFRLAEAGAVGVGVRGDADLVTATLLDGRGERLAAGVLEIAELEAGEYLLALTLAPGSRPVRARPVVVGVEPPSKGPPAEVVKSYLEQARAGDGGEEEQSW